MSELEIKNVPINFQDEWITEYETLCESENSSTHTLEEKQKIEEKKLKIINHFTQYLNKKYAKDTLNEAEEKLQKPSWGRKISFILFFIMGVSLNAIFDFLYGQSIVSLIPGLTNTLSLSLCLLFTFLNVALYYSFEIVMLKQALGVKTIRNEVKSIIEIFDEQIESAIRSNQILFDANNVDRMSEKDYKKYARIAILINEDLKKKEKIIEYHESYNKKISRWGLTTFGALMMVASGYFAATSLLDIIAPLLLGTLTGWIITFLIIASSLASYFSMRGQGVNAMINPELYQFMVIKDKIKILTKKSSEDYNKISLNKCFKLNSNSHMNINHNEEKYSSKNDFPLATHSFLASTKAKVKRSYSCSNIKGMGTGLAALA